MSQTENCVIDFFADGIEQSHVAVDVLCHAMGLHYLYTGTSIEVVDVVQIIVGNDVVGIKYQGYVIIITESAIAAFKAFDLVLFSK